MASGKPTAHIEPSSSAGGPIPTLSISRTRIINVTITKGGVTVVEQKPLITSVQQTASKPRDSFDIVQCYHAFLLDKAVSTPVATFKSLVEFVKHSQASTMSEFMQTLEDAAQQIRAISSADAGAWRTSHLLSTAQGADGKSPIHSQYHHKATIATLAGCDLFMRFVARTSHDAANFETYRTLLISRGEIILDKAAAARDKAAEIGSQFIRDNAVILVHSYSRIVMRLLERAAAQNRRFKVYVTESRPTSEGLTAAVELRESGIPTTVILDSAVGYVMDKVDLVLVGAEGVVENGGVINQIGTYQIAIVAKAAKKPLYAVAESYKFVRLFPLNQYDLPHQSPEILTFGAPHTHRRSTIDALAVEPVDDFAVANPSVDYTPPDLITLLLTDLGVLTPSGVSDELIKLYL